MPITFQCTCGKTLSAPDGSAGKQARCPICNAILPIPTPEPFVNPNEYDIAPSAAPRPIAPPPRPKIPSTYTVEDRYPTPSLTPTGPRGIRSFTYVLLLFALIPLILTTFQKKESIAEKFVRTIQAHQNDPGFTDTINKEFDQDGNPTVSDQQLFASFPNDRLDGALFAKDTHAHWLLGLLAAICFLSFILLAFPNALRFTKGLLFAGIFTGTAGVLLLLGFQFVAFHMPWFHGGGVFGLIMLVVKLIGLSYALAESNSGFFLSFLGFTAGVGLCEEFTKAIPLLFRISPTPGEENPTWYSLLLWGLASGSGFGIAEGIMYSGHYYNGIEGPGIYVVRFVSCVALHAMWAGANGINLYRHQAKLLGANNKWEYFFRVIAIVIVPMTLHGLYDTLLKQEYDGYALLVGLATFAWLAFQIERAYHSERRPAPAYT